jgi:hypothetical protein
MAEESYAGGNYRGAAGQWGKVVGGRPGFEEVALQLVGCGDPEALQVFLEAKLKVGAPWYDVVHACDTCVVCCAGPQILKPVAEPHHHT